MEKSTPAQSQGPETDFALHTLGWKAFQDLSAEIMREEFKCQIEVYRPSADGGRDACFVTRPELPDAGRHVAIQVKHSNDRYGALKLSSLRSEQSNIEELVKAGLADGYVVVSNRSLSGDDAGSISMWLLSLGVKQPYVFGKEALNMRLRASSRLRALVPRVYGLGDLSWIQDERKIDQARAVLQYLGNDGLKTYVPTAVHRRAVYALHNIIF